MSLIEQPQNTPKSLREHNKSVARAPRRWPKGQSGNPKGRAKGSRDAVTKQFMYALADVFSRKGKHAMERMADTDPSAFIRVCASLVPKDIKLSAGPLAELTEQELNALAYAAQRLAASDESEAEDHR